MGLIVRRVAETSILPTILPAIISAVSGLAGVGIGAWITLWKERAKEERDRSSRRQVPGSTCHEPFGEARPRVCKDRLGPWDRR